MTKYLLMRRLGVWLLLQSYTDMNALVEAVEQRLPPTAAMQAKRWKVD